MTSESYVTLKYIPFFSPLLETQIVITTKMAIYHINNGSSNDFVCLLSIESFSSYHGLGIVLGPWDLRLNKIHMIPASRCSCVERRVKAASRIATEDVFRFFFF